MNRIHVRGAAVAMLVAAAACGDSATEVVGDALTQAEAEALAEVVAGTVVSTWDEGAAAAAPALATFQQSVEVDAPCELGGRVAIAGDLTVNVDDVTEDVTLDYTVTQTHQACVAESQEGLVFTLTGAPNVTANLSVQSEGDLVALDGSYSGGVDWSTDDKSGTCQLSVEFSADLNIGGETGSASMSGTVCGTSFSRSMTIS